MAPPTYEDTGNTTLLKAGKVVYYAAGILLLYYLCKGLFDTQRQVASVLVFILGIFALAFYWRRFFAPQGPLNSTVWPPVVTTCPDFLTPEVAADKSFVCVDYVGVKVTNASTVATPGKPETSAGATFKVAPKGSSVGFGAWREQVCTAATSAGYSWSTLCGDNLAVWG